RPYVDESPMQRMRYAAGSGATSTGRRKAPAARKPSSTSTTASASPQRTAPILLARILLRRFPREPAHGPEEGVYLAFRARGSGPSVFREILLGDLEPLVLPLPRGDILTRPDPMAVVDGSGRRLRGRIRERGGFREDLHVDPGGLLPRRDASQQRVELRPRFEG